MSNIFWHLLSLFIGIAIGWLGHVLRLASQTDWGK